MYTSIQLIVKYYPLHQDLQMPIFSGILHKFTLIDGNMSKMKAADPKLTEKQSNLALHFLWGSRGTANNGFGPIP